ncbi:PQQ-dependent sugar dehydrogenase [Daejeonella sp. H1SJ63]|uniref:PQQ-dependent sugar dehydrogenase n=1 Tax=Daejeonella sp. H1SJ63 TaxID=3034145 RepID=UPI0023EAD943|nr:PQQ-dependent sugar dehydrogenase [Daejeonella sp. H1SJ63]
MKKYILFLLAGLIISSCSPHRQPFRVLYFSKDTTGRHAENLKIAGRANGWKIILTNNENYFLQDSLSGMDAIFLPYSSVNRLGYRSVPELKRYLEAGRGGIITIRDTVLTQQWPWLSAWNDQGDEWKQDKGWVRRIEINYNADDLRKSLAENIAKNKTPDYAHVTTSNVPDSSRYIRTVLAQGFDEPMAMAILPNNDVVLAERKGSLKIYNRETKQIRTITNFNVFSGIEDGLLGLAADPRFKENHWMYFYYSVAGERAVNRLSRFELSGDSLVMSSEKILMEIPTQRKYCCHSAGYITFDKNGLLYLSTGDNTNAEETEGYTPVDERPGHSLADDQATAANTNDLRGKILRIKPLDNGTYAIPEGNLFPEGNPKGRPEIYIMGSRNPYRFSVDKKSNYLYWGDVGPDTKVMGQEGEFMSYDEINQARKPGFYGWPYFLGNNEAFPKYDFATKQPGAKKDPSNPVNDSPNNTGERILPPAQPAMIWFGKKTSKRFPLLGNGGASAMAGPVYYSDQYPGSPYKLHDYYNGKLFIYEWIRGWIMAVSLDENGNYLRMEPFLEHLKFKAPVDMQFGPDGALYVLEYGTNWFSKNIDAKLVRIEYMEGNRNPVAEIAIDKQYGAAPFTVHFSGKKSLDHDPDDQLSYSWNLDGKDLKGETISYTFVKSGVHTVTLTVSDNKGGKGIVTSQVFAGNTPPEIRIATSANRSFYWDNSLLDYQVLVNDQEEKIINPEKVKVSFGYIPRGKDLAVILSRNQDAGSSGYLKGQQLAATLDCRACHSLDKASVGPTYQAISTRYKGKAAAVASLSDKIIKGGSGVWGERAMTPHPELSKADAEEIVNYILSVSEKPEKQALNDRIVLKDHIGKGTEGTYLLNASYTDQGANGIEPIQSRDYIALRNPLVQAEDFDEGNVRLGTITTVFLTYATGIGHNSFMRFNKIDLSHVKQLKYRVQAQAGGKIEVRIGRMDGPLISSLNIPSRPAGVQASWKEFMADLNETSGVHDLYFVFTDTAGKKGLFDIDWIYFSNIRE